MGELGEQLETLSLEASKVSPVQLESEDYDTDLEFEDIAKASTKKDLSEMYIKACQQEGIVPVSYFIRHINDTHIELSHHGLGPKSTSAIAISLKSNTSITHLSLEDNWIMEEGLVHLMDMMRVNCYIQDLNLSHNHLGVQGSQIIADMLLENVSLQRINLAQNEFKDESAKHFAEAFSANFRVSELNLSHNEFCEEGGANLGQMLAANEGLQVLDLSWNHIRMKGAIALSAGLQVNDTLKVLNLSYNGFGNEGALALGEALKVNTSIQHLDISCNRINNEGVRLLCKGLDTNETLRVLKLSRNPLSVEAALFLLTSITKNPENKVEELDISNVLVNAQFLSRLETACRSRPELHIIYAGKQGFTARKLAARPDPMKVIQNYLDERKLRLIDFFKKMDKDGSMRIPISDFCRHISLAGLPLDGAQMEALLQTLDKEQTGSVDYRDLVDSRKKMVKEHREKLRRKERRERQERQRSQRALRSFHNAVRALTPPPAPKVAAGGSASSAHLSVTSLSSWYQEGEAKTNSSILYNQSGIFEGARSTESPENDRYYSSQGSMGSPCISGPPSSHSVTRDASHQDL
ncbi:leucine-rich repeat-containing 74A [Pelobates cultripes]|uniref:Leucine-rich repeat-containing 74A n=1 Tax=Pelobates cultripes TaxID=61616 RepID=A0AAD1TNN8_PELCU|nr:leucine-rich repeat-containing 74A [Pelobates cultripes]